MHGHNSSYLNLGVSKLLKPKHGTISLWINLERRIYSGKGYDANPIIGTRNGPGNDYINAYVVAYQCFSGKLTAASTQDSLRGVDINSLNSINFNNWYHIAISFDSTYLSFYINGELQGKFLKGYETKYLSSDSVMVGHSASKKNERYAQGSFDDIAIFHRVLTNQEILDLYNAPNPNKLKNVFYEILKYGIIIFVLIVIIIVLIIRNKNNLKKQKEQFELINRITELELKVVKAQMNPHFISNCLAAIQELIYTGEVDKAGQYIAKFSYFLRQVLNYSDKNYISIREEIEIIKLNVELEQLRFKNKFEFQLSVEEGIDPSDVLILALITQPFIENAVWHGLLPMNNKREPILKINISIKNNMIYIEIEDNGVGRDLNKPTDEKSKGTKLIMDKIESLNRQAGSLNYKIEIVDLKDIDERPGGTKVIIQLNHMTL